MRWSYCARQDARTLFWLVLDGGLRAWTTATRSRSGVQGPGSVRIDGMRSRPFPHLSCLLLYQNSNLVLTADRSRGPAEPSGAPETLAGRLHRMGDRVRFDAPDGLAERKAKAKSKREVAAKGGGGEDWDAGGGAKRARRVSSKRERGKREARHAERRNDGGQPDQPRAPPPLLLLTLRLSLHFLHTLPGRHRHRPRPGRRGWLPPQNSGNPGSL